MADIKTKFNQIVRRLNYNQITVLDIDAAKIESWSYKNIPDVVSQLETLGWNLDNDNTWEETIFLNSIIKWYGNRIGLYITSSYLDYKLAYSLLDTVEFSNLRKDFNLSNHTVLLLDPIILIDCEDLDSIYNNLDFTKHYGYIDYSHYDDKEQLYKDYLDEWNWLQAEDQDDTIWTGRQINKVLAN